MARGFLKGRRGFTIVELLVVIAIIGLLVAITIPAVQMAREASRKSECSSKLRQLALACQAFHDANQRFPPGSVGGEYKFGPDSRGWSWMARILPYVECDPVYRIGRIPESTLRKSQASYRQIPLFLCPSDSFSHLGPRRDAGNFADEKLPLGQTNYKGVSGANWGADDTLNVKALDTPWRNQGKNGSYDGLNDGDGIMWRIDIRARIRTSDVTDGLSNTFMLGEDLPEYNRWCSWPYGSHAYGTCAIPPNLIFSDTNKWEDTHSFRSAHPGGLFFAMADGSARFINDRIALKVYRGLATRNGSEAVQTPE